MSGSAPRSRACWRAGRLDADDHGDQYGEAIAASAGPERDRYRDRSRSASRTEIGDHRPSQATTPRRAGASMTMATHSSDEAEGDFLQRSLPATTGSADGGPGGAQQQERMTRNAIPKGNGQPRPSSARAGGRTARPRPAPGRSAGGPRGGEEVASSARTIETMMTVQGSWKSRSHGGRWTPPLAGTAASRWPITKPATAPATPVPTPLARTTSRMCCASRLGRRACRWSAGGAGPGR